MDMEMERETEAVKKTPLVAGAIFFILLGSVIAFVTSRGKTISPLPEAGLRVIFVSPMPTDTPAPTASPSATPRVKKKPTATPKPKPTATPESKEEASPTPAEPTATPEETVSPTPTG